MTSVVTLDDHSPMVTYTGSWVTGGMPAEYDTYVSLAVNYFCAELSMLQHDSRPAYRKFGVQLHFRWFVSFC